MRALQSLLALLAALAVLGPVAHVLELPNKLALDGPLWLAVQQHLYRGWGPFIGAPIEIGALFVSLVLAFLSRRTAAIARPAIAATVLYAGMIATFFLFSAPVNEVVDHSTAQSLPATWPALRLRWETGHAISATLAVIALAVAVRAWLHGLRIPRQ